MKKTDSRRAFIEKGLKLGLVLPLAGTRLLASNPILNFQKAPKPRPSGKLNILILGGTSFLGPHQIAYALKQGHSVTTFTRGKTKPTIYRDLFEKVTSLTGDRANDLTALENGTWDAVIDNSGHNAEWTKRSAALLKDRAGLYLYTSSTGVYYPYLGKNIKEDAQLLLVEPEGIEDEEMKLEYWYGVMKSNSEIAAGAEFGEDRTIVVRPTYMVGPADKSDRFIHWPVRLATGGEILVPGKKNDPVQYIDVRDVAEWMIRLIEERKTGTFNAVGPKRSQNMYSFVKEAGKAFDVNSSLIYVDDYKFLKEQHINNLIPWIMPEGNNTGSARVNNKKGIKAGLSFRNLQDTIKDTYDWWYSDALTDERRNKFEQNPEAVLLREKAVLGAWKRYEKN
ncbi:MAG: NAD-dependent epimerase/dehydratase family protein [Lewinellaceae bacterium]|nr:NAD-dependent epimerase/dehydratase family protein [Lewinellaceae bacterium]